MIFLDNVKCIKKCLLNKSKHKKEKNKTKTNIFVKQIDPSFHFESERKE